MAGASFSARRRGRWRPFSLLLRCPLRSGVKVLVAATVQTTDPRRKSGTCITEGCQRKAEHGFGGGMAFDEFIKSRLYGCGDGGCVFGHGGGMHTNGGCRCLPSLGRTTSDDRVALRDKIFALVEYADKQDDLVKKLKDQRGRVLVILKEIKDPRLVDEFLDELNAELDAIVGSAS